MVKGENAHLSGVLWVRNQIMVNVLKYKMFKPNSSCPARNLVLPENSAQDHTFVNLILRLSQILMAHYSKYPKSDHSSATPAHSSLVPGALPSLLPTHLSWCIFFIALIYIRRHSIYKFVYLFIIFPSPKRKICKTGPSLSRSSLYPPCLKQCLTHSRCSIDICWIIWYNNRLFPPLCLIQSTI